MLNSFRIVFVTVGGDEGGGPGTIPRCDYVQSGGENFIFTDWGFNPDNIDDTELSSWTENYAYDPRTLENMMDAYGLVEGDDGRATVLDGRDKETLITACAMSDLETTDADDLFTRGGDNDLLIPSASFPNSPVVDGTTASHAITADDSGFNKVRVNTVDIPVVDDWPQYIYIGAVGAGGAGRGCLASVPEGLFGGNPCPFSGDNTNLNICEDTIFDDPDYKAGGTGAEGSFFLRICGANPEEDADGNEERRTLTVVTKIGRGGIKSWDSGSVRTNKISVVEFPDQTLGEKDTTVTVYDGEIDISSPDTTKQVLKLTCPGGGDSSGTIQRMPNNVGCDTDLFCTFCSDSNPDGDDVLDVTCCDPSKLNGTLGRVQPSADNSKTGSFLDLSDNYFKSQANGNWSVVKVSTDQPTDAINGEFGTAITPDLTEFGISSHSDWYSNMRGWNAGTDTTKLYQPGLAGNGKFKHWRFANTAHASTDVDGSGGNGGSVYIGYGANVFSKAAVFNEPGGGGEGGGGNATNNLTAGSGFSGFIKPKADRTFEYVSTEEEALNYSPVGDANATGRDAAVIFRMTETPDITREGDFYLTAQAYHMEDIDKITFIMDGGESVDVFEPVNHPNDLGTDYDKTASGLGNGYKEFMVRVDTSTLSHNTVHEIRAIAWPKHGYPVVLQGEKPLIDSDLPDSQWKINPVKYPWIQNVYPDSITDLSEHEILDVDPPGVAAGDPIINPVTGDETWYQSGRDSVICGYYGFHFRYQDPALRKRVYINPLNTNNVRTGTKTNPYRTLSDALHSIETLSSADQKDYLSASFYLMGPEADSSSPIGITGGVHDWFTSNHSGLGQDDDQTGGGRQVITVEADPEYFASKPDYFNLDAQFPQGSSRDQIILLPFNGGGPTRMWAPDQDLDDDGFVYNSAPQLSVHYKNLRTPVGVPNFASNYFFEAAERRSDRGCVIILDSVHVEPWSVMGKHYNYIGYTGVERNSNQAPGGFELSYADMDDPCQGDPDCEGCVDGLFTDDCTAVPWWDEANGADGYCLPGTNCKDARDKSSVPSDPSGTGLKADWQLGDPRLPYYNMFIGKDAFYPEFGWSEATTGRDLNRKLVMPSGGGSYIMNTACRSLIGRRGQGMLMMKNHLEQFCSGDTSANFSGALINHRADFRDGNFEGYRSIVSGINVVHSDMQQIDKSTNYWIDNRMMVDITLTNNAAQLFHLSGLDDVIGPPWEDVFSKCCICMNNPDPCRRTNAQKQACNACDAGDEAACAECVRSCLVHASQERCEGELNGDWQPTSAAGSWVRTHAIRNFALVRFASDGWVSSNGGNNYRTWDHMYVKGLRLRNSNVGFGPTRSTQGFTWNGENFDSSYRHFYYADNQENKMAAGGLHKEGDFRTEEMEERALSYSLGYYRTTSFNTNNTSKFPPLAPGEGEDPIDPNRCRQYLPMRDPFTGNSVVEGAEFAVTDASPDSDSYQGFWRTIGQFADPRKSIIHWDTCMYEDKDASSSFSADASGVELIYTMLPNPYSPTDNPQIIPPLDVAYSQSAGCDNNVCGPAVGIFGGLVSNGSDPVTVDYEDKTGNIHSHTLKFLPSYAQSVVDLTSPHQGLTAPPTTNAGDIERSGRFGVSGWPNAGEPVLNVIAYDYKLFHNARANGGFNYTDHIQYATNYTPHKL